MKHPKVELTCSGCGRVFLRNYCHVNKGFKTVWCSKKCWGKSTLNDLTCQTCGKKYKRYRSQCGQKFCSVNCFHESLNLLEKVTCLKCGKVFKKHQRSKANRFCSLPCYHASMRLSSEEFNKRRAEYTRKYRKEHREWYLFQKRKRRALEAGAEGSHTLEEWNEVKRKHKHRCAHCGKKKKLTVDHIKSLSKGGSNHISNIQPLCGSCNSSKWAKELNASRVTK